MNCHADDTLGNRHVSGIVQHVGSHTQRVSVLSQARVLRDPGGRWALEDVLALDESSGGAVFEPLDGRFSKGYTRDAFWLRFVLTALDIEDDSHLDKWLVVRPPFLQDLRLFSMDPDGAWHEARAGTFVPVHDRALAVPETVFPLFLAGREQVFYLRVASTSTLVMSLDLWEPEAFLERSAGTYMRHGIFLGMVATAVVISLLCAIWMKQRVFFFAAAYLMGYGVLLFILNGYDQILIYPGATWLANHTVGLLTVGVAALLVGFALCYLEPRRHFPRITATLALLAWACVGGVALSMLGLYAWIAAAGALVTTAIIVLLMALYVLMIRHAPQRALVMLALFLVPTVAALVQIMRNMGVFPVSFWTTDLWELTAFFQIPFAAVVVLMRVREEEQRHRVAVEREQAQRQFLHLVAHEIRTPLSVIRVALANLRARMSGGEQERPRFQRMETAVARLNALVDNALAEDRLRALDHAPRFEQIAPSQLIAQVCELLSLDRDRHRLDVSLPDNDEPVNVDVEWLSLALLNLLDNAVKYSPDGGPIRLEIERDRDMLVLRVADKGQGIAADDQTLVFTRFFRADAARQRTDTSGLGLGLYLVSEVAKRHGGRIDLRSNAGEGSVFTLRIPLDGSDEPMS